LSKSAVKRGQKDNQRAKYHRQNRAAVCTRLISTCLSCCGSAEKGASIALTIGATGVLPAPNVTATAAGAGLVINSGIVTQNAGGTIAEQNLYINGGGTLTLNGVTVTGGSASVGGGIQNAGTTTLDLSTVRGNTAADNGGAGLAC
jgi:hypothetical protein